MAAPDELKDRASSEAIKAVTANAMLPLAYGVLADTVLRFMRMAYTTEMRELEGKTIPGHPDVVHQVVSTKILLSDLFGEDDFWHDDAEQEFLLDQLRDLYNEGTVIRDSVKALINNDRALEIHYLMGLENDD